MNKALGEGPCGSIPTWHQGGQWAQRFCVKASQRGQGGQWVQRVLMETFQHGQGGQWGAEGPRGGIPTGCQGGQWVQRELSG